MQEWLIIRIKQLKLRGLFIEKGVDLIFLNISTYALSHNVLPLIQRVSCPVIILNLQPTEAIDYETFNAIGRQRQNDRRMAFILSELRNS